VSPVTLAAAQRQAPASRRTRKQQEQLPEFLPQACEFSDDPNFQNELWMIEAIKRELTTP